MKILQICNKPPYPPVDGGTIGMNSATQGLLSAGCEVKVITAYSYKHPVLQSLITNEYREQTKFEALFINLRFNIFKALLCLITRKSYHAKRFQNKRFEKRIIEILKTDTFDIIQVESLFFSSYVNAIRQYTSAKIILRSHNVEHLIWQRIANNTRNILKRWYLKQLSTTLKRYELEQLKKYNGIVCVSENDILVFQEYGINVPLISIPFVITNPEEIANVSTETNSLFHIGSMDWLPNLEGVTWFLTDIWPLVTKKLPQIKLYLAGRKMPDSLLKYNELYSNIQILGEIDDAVYFMASKEINIVPLLSGSGIRVKIIEAMSLGKVVITTTVGGEGIPYEEGIHLLIANTPDEFVKQIEKCVNDTLFCEKIGRNAQDLILNTYNINQLTIKLLNFYRSL